MNRCPVRIELQIFDIRNDRFICFRISPHIMELIVTIFEVKNTYNLTWKNFFYFSQRSLIPVTSGQKCFEILILKNFSLLIFNYNTKKKTYIKSRSSSALKPNSVMHKTMFVQFSCLINEIFPLIFEIWHISHWCYVKKKINSNILPYSTLYICWIVFIDLQLICEFKKTSKISIRKKNCFVSIQNITRYNQNKTLFGSTDFSYV